MGKGDVESFSFEQFFWSSADLMSVVDVDGNFVLVKAAFHHVLGWEPAALGGRLYTNFIHPDDLAHPRGVFDPVDGVAPTVAEMELRERCRDDSYRWMKWTVRKDGGLYYAVGHDITLRRDTFAALAESLEKSRAIFDAA